MKMGSPFRDPMVVTIQVASRASMPVILVLPLTVPLILAVPLILTLAASVPMFRGPPRRGLGRDSRLRGTRGNGLPS